MVVDDAYNFFKIHQLSGNHCTVSTPPVPEVLATTIVSRAEISHDQSKPIQASSPSDTQSLSNVPKLYVLSAGSETSLVKLIDCYADYFKEGTAKGTCSQAFLDDLAYTLGSRRTHLPWRSFFTASSDTDLQTVDRNSSTPREKNETLPCLGFVFTGQGAQWYGMGQELMAYSAFYESVRESDIYLQNLGCEWSVCGKLHDPTSTFK